MAHKRVEIIIPVCNKCEYTQKILEDIFKYTDPNLEWGVTIVDNGSTDATANMKCLQWDRVKYLKLDKNYGFGTACNDGAKLHKDKACHLLFLNNDVRLPDRWLNRLLAVLKEPTIGIVGPFTNHAASQQKINLLDHERWRELDSTLEKTSKHLYSIVPVITGFCMLVREECWRQIGLFDDDVFLLSGEDFDLCIRARRKGWNVVTADGVFVYHYGHVTAKDLPNEGKDYWRAGADGLRKKYGPAFLK